MIPGINQKQAKMLMKRMGIKQKELDAEEVIIKTPGKEIIIKNPQVSIIEMMGQNTFQITGDITERERQTAPDITEEDIKTVMEQANVSHEKALEAIAAENGDLAKAILSLTQDNSQQPYS